ncbi:MAG: FAD-dependent oxidoreductase, partial [Gemmatimonadetes bacterium]|nr:FAD-dependent oxidoreductase [Gemmatimonadota bacterium]
MNTQPRNIVVIGGVAGGASAAARARRLSETARIIMVEKGPHVSFANCGLPYRIGGEIPTSDKLLLQTPESLYSRHRLDVRVLTEAVNIDRESGEVELLHHLSGRRYREHYDALVISTGAAPLKPPIPGIERPGHFTVRNVPDAEAILQWIETAQARRAVVVGGGYIGLEAAEQLRHLGLEVSIAEAFPQVMTPLDPEMAEHLHRELRRNDVRLHLGDGVASFDAPLPEEEAAASTVVLRSGARLPADLVILGLGVRPEVSLAREAGLDLGERGGVRVDEQMRTSDPRIWAVGDAVEVRDGVTGKWTLMSLAGPANRQGRIAADAIFGLPTRYRGAWGTAVLRLFGLTAGCTGAGEKVLVREGIPYQTVHLHPLSHAGYYPGAHSMALKVLFSPDDGRLLGAQAVGADGVDKRIDVLATALQAGMSVSDLTDLDLAYAPPFGSARDPVNMAGMIADNLLGGLSNQKQWNEVEEAVAAGAQLLDVRDTTERKRDGMIPDSI